MRVDSKMIGRAKFVNTVENSILSENLPLITIGVVVLNREWIIGDVLNSISRQTYPHNKIFVLIMDGKSTDKTVEIAREILEKSDFRGFEIVVKKCNIPEGRNICIEKMRGDLLLFWDSDVIMEPEAVSKLIKTMTDENKHIVTADKRQISVRSIDEIDNKIAEAFIEWRFENYVHEVPAAGMGHTLIHREVFESVKFERHLTAFEDFDFCVRARQKGYKIIMNKGVKAFDINILRKDYSDIYISMPLRDALKELRRKARTSVLAYSFTINFTQMAEFFSKEKRFIYYLGYFPIFILLILGTFLENIFLILIFTAYLAPYVIYQLKRRGFKKGLHALVRSILVGLPLSLLVVYYFIKYSFRRLPAVNSLIKIAS